MSDNNPETTAVRKVLNKAWADSQFKQRLLSDANAALAEIGVAVPAGTTIRVVADAPGVRNYVLPMQGTAISELSDDHLEVVVGGLTNLHRTGGDKGQ